MNSLNYYQIDDITKIIVNIFEDRFIIHPLFQDDLSELTYINKIELENSYKENGYHLNSESRTYSLLKSILGTERIKSILIPIYQITILENEKPVIEFKTGDSIAIEKSILDLHLIEKEKESKIKGVILSYQEPFYYSKDKVPLIEICSNSIVSVESNSTENHYRIVYFRISDYLKKIKKTN